MNAVSVASAVGLTVVTVSDKRICVEAPSSARGWFLTTSVNLRNTLAWFARNNPSIEND